MPRHIVCSDLGRFNLAIWMGFFSKKEPVKKSALQDFQNGDLERGSLDVLSAGGAS